MSQEAKKVDLIIYNARPNEYIVITDPDDPEFRFRLCYIIEFKQRIIQNIFIVLLKSFH